jgi:AcrR family transcriptional regulator
MNSIAQRRFEDRERRRTEIVDAADALARERGWDDVTVDGVAKRARLSRALVYLYFKDKTDLHAALCERATADLCRRFNEAISGCEGDCRFEAIGRAYVNFAAEMPHYFESLSRFEATSAEQLEDETSRKAFARQHQVHQLMIDVLRDGQRSGAVRADCGDLAQTAVALWAFTHGLILISSRKRRHLDELGVGHEALLEQAFTMLRRTIAPNA